MTLRRPLFVLLMVVAVSATGFLAWQQVRTRQAHAHAEAEAAATQKWDAQLKAYLSRLSVPPGARAVASDTPAACAESPQEVCWATATLPPQADEAVVAAVIAAGAQPVADPVLAGCSRLNQPGYPGSCAHLFSLPGGHVLVELFPHRVSNNNGQSVSFDGSEVVIQGMRTRADKQ